MWPHWIISLFAVSAATPGAFPPPERIRVEEKWSLSEGQYEGKVLITRFNKGLASLIGHPAYRHQLGIATPLLTRTPNGLPESSEQPELQQLEDALVQILTPGNAALFAGVISTNNMREFVFYSRSPELAKQKLEMIRKRFPKRVIQLAIQPDATWETFKTFVK